MTLEFFLYWLVLPLLVAGLVLTFVRLLKGPNVASRVIALDMTAVLGIGMIVVYAVLTNQPVLVDVAAVLALVSFLGTIAFSFYLELRP